MADLSGTITTGGTAQTLSADSLYRGRFYIQNTSTGDLRIKLFGGTASSTNGIRVAAGDLYESPLGTRYTGAISLWGATTGQTFEAGDL